MVFIILFVLSCGRRRDPMRENTNEGVYVESSDVKSEPLESNHISIQESEPDYKIADNQASNGNSKSLSELFETLSPSVFTVYSMNSDGSYAQGSGFFIGSDIALTNTHVIEDANSTSDIIIELENGSQYYVTEILKYSASSLYDYCVFRINQPLYLQLPIASALPKIGDDIFTIGSPLGLKNSLSKGTVAGFREGYLIQIDATIDHGSSGGPLFNMNGEVIGITSSGMDGGSELNFAIDIQEIDIW